MSQIIWQDSVDKKWPVRVVRTGSHTGTLEIRREDSDEILHPGGN